MAQVMVDAEAVAPVNPHAKASAEHVEALGAGIALCLSGGGYRAMLFHAGALWRLNELGLMHDLAWISSVSGGSITAGVLAVAWPDFRFVNQVATNFAESVVAPLRRLAHVTIDLPAIAIGLLPGQSASARIAAAFRDHLYGDKTLADLPAAPWFVINAANVQSGGLWRFTRTYMADWRVGMHEHPEKISLATAVAASSAFPPVLSPCVLELDPTDYRSTVPNSLGDDAYRRSVVLSDGGVYDNLGLETAYKRFTTLLVSDGCAPFTHDPSPHHDWAHHGVRCVELVLNQAAAQRKRLLVAAYDARQRDGCYWGIGADRDNYTKKCPSLELMKFDARVAEVLAQMPTRLAKLDDDQQDALINWGYVMCDTAVRGFYRTSAPRPTGTPYPNS